jgi:L-alanine-DL-glutamate epimerase-like enolase superfamily enzyme
VISESEELIGSVEAEVYKIPTDLPEADGTLAWSSTNLVVVRVRCGKTKGLGWSYASLAAKMVVDDVLSQVVLGRDPMAVPGANEAMVRACRNLGRPGVAATAISAVDIALWDLKARILGISLSDLFGRARDDAPVYASGGFTTYADSTTREQLDTWVHEWEIPRVKIKIGESWGTHPARDLHRVALARDAAGETAEIYVDANGAYQRKQAIRIGHAMTDAYGVEWFEEPVSSDDLVGLREVRDQCAADVAAGEYGYSTDYFARMISSGSVDCLQADVTRCGGFTAWLAAAHLAAAHQLQISAHCAPNLHAHVAVAVPNLRHMEYFHDHHLIETRYFDGSLPPRGGSMCPRSDSPGHGLTFRNSDIESLRVA